MQKKIYQGKNVNCQQIKPCDVQHENDRSTAMALPNITVGHTAAQSPLVQFAAKKLGRGTVMSSLVREPPNVNI